ncbi:MAG: hypothetical protein HZA92_02385 [Verrucomicrobia bacterium]|nr:hypothetical protein [Verrucomicrobiota bacterium]
MNAKADRQQQRVVRKLARELKDNARVPGFLVRLCRWEKMRHRHGLFTLQHRHD